MTHLSTTKHPLPQHHTTSSFIFVYRMFLKHVLITALGEKWVGIWRLSDGKVILIRWGCIPWMKVHCEVIKKRKHHWEAKLLWIESWRDKPLDTLSHWWDTTIFRSPACSHCINPLLSTQAPEEHTVGCWWCLRQHLTYTAQIEIKNKLFLQTLWPLSNKIHTSTIGEILPAPKEWWYRNKIEFSFGKYIVRQDHKSIEKHRQVWFHKQGQFSKVINVNHCHIVEPAIHDVYTSLISLCQDSWLPVYDTKSNEWFFRHLVLRYGHHTWEIMAHLVINGSFLDEKTQKIREKTQKKLITWAKKSITTLCLTNNTGVADVVKGIDHTMRIMYGDGFITDKLFYWWLSVSFRISPFTFFQTNTLGAEKLFSMIVDLIPTNYPVMLDLYCGWWSIGQYCLLAKKTAYVIGVEIVPEAVHDAKINAQTNQMDDRTLYVCGKVEDVLKTNETLKQYYEKTRLIIIDPPREWLHPSIIPFLITHRQRYPDTCLIYVSCNPSTFVRDAQLLCDGGRSLDTIKWLDLFPQTYHYELVARFF